MLLDDHEEAPKEDSTLLDDQEVAPKEDSTHTAAEASPTKTRDEDNESQGRDPHDTPANNAGEPKSRTEKGELDDAAPATKSAQPDARNIALPHRAVNKKVVSLCVTLMSRNMLTHLQAVVLPEVPARVREVRTNHLVESTSIANCSPSLSRNCRSSSPNWSAKACLTPRNTSPSSSLNLTPTELARRCQLAMRTGSLPIDLRSPRTSGSTAVHTPPHLTQMTLMPTKTTRCQKGPQS